MKRKFLFGASFLLVAWAVTSCEALSDCESCKWVTTDSSNGDVTEAPVETEYCGATLIAIKLKTTTNGTRTTTYKCH
jgi:hypothetical protein